MNEMDPYINLSSKPDTRVVDVPARQSEQTAEVRAMAYAIFSRLMASPFEQTDEQMDVWFRGDLAEAIKEVNGELPYELELGPLADAVAAFGHDDLAFLRRSYSSKFEVGNDGPAVPLRAELVRAKETKMKEELVRFYDFFSYKLRDEIAWAPDHVSIQLEFMQLLCLKETEADEAGRESFARAQLDFLDRHIISWLPISVGKIVQRDKGDFYTLVLTTMWEFLEKDRAWNGLAITDIEGEG